MAAWNVICRYRDVAAVVAADANKFKPLPDGGIYTGHHLIADHCWYATNGAGKEATVILPHYHIDEAPVIIVTADANGGKSRQHREVHDIFDPLEDAAAEVEDLDGHGGAWAYVEARDAAAASVMALGAREAAILALDAYFTNLAGFEAGFVIRAGERTVWGPERYAPRRSKRNKH